MANKILEKIGLAADAVNFLIPTFNVKAAYTMATWHGIGSSKTKVVQGTVYTLYYPDGSMDKETVGDYYNQNSFKNKNTSLALKLGKLNYVGFTTYAVTKWE